MKTNYTHIAMVLDRSGSMSSIATDTIGGVNQFFGSQKSVPGECTATLVQFDDVIESVFERKPINDVPSLDGKTYQPRNSTALYDAIGRTINQTGAFLSGMAENDRPAKVIFAIVTDGFENASREFNQTKVFDMIKTQRETYKWEFVFIGANQDALQAGANIGIPTSHSLNYAANSQGTSKLYGALASNVTRMRCAVSSGDMTADVSWQAFQRKEQDAAK